MFFPAKSLLLQAVAMAALMATNYNSIPGKNTDQQHFDALIVLGTPCTTGGQPSPEQRERVLEGVREYKAGVAPRIIMSGGPAHNHFVEADCMKHLAVAEGVPPSDVYEDTQAKDTVQNIWFSDKIMEAHGWRSAEVVSSPSHLPRAALILEHYAFAWRTHASRWPAEYKQEDIRKRYAGEIKSCWKLTHSGFGHNQWLPGS